MRHAAGMLTTLGFASALLLAPSLANATDLPPMSPVAPQVIEEPPTWQGFYIGGNLGAAFDPYNLSIKDLSAAQDLTLKFSTPDLIAALNLQPGETERTLTLTATLASGAQIQLQDCVIFPGGDKPPDVPQLRNR